MNDLHKDIKDKWNQLSLFGKKTKGFKGQGQKLGTAEAPKVTLIHPDWSPSAKQPISYHKQSSMRRKTVGVAPWRELLSAPHRRVAPDQTTRQSRQCCSTSRNALICQSASPYLQSSVDKDRAVRPASAATLRSGPPSGAKPRPPPPKPADAAPPPRRRLGFSDSRGSSDHSSGSSAAAAAAASRAGASVAAPAASSAAPAPAQSYGFAQQAPQPATEPLPRNSSSDGAAAAPAAATDYETAEPGSEEMEAAVALLRSEEHGAASVTLLTKVLHNILSKPAEEKFRCSASLCTSLMPVCSCRGSMLSTATVHAAGCDAPPRISAEHSCGAPVARQRIERLLIGSRHMLCKVRWVAILHRQNR